MLRSALYCAAATGMLALFGCEVCPYIESLGQATLAVLFAAFFLVAWLLRIPLHRAVVARAPLLSQARRQFLLDLGLFVSVGLCLTLFDRVVFGFPLASGLKATLGAATVGLFFAADSALAKEREVARIIARGEAEAPPVERVWSLTRRFTGVAVAVVLLVVVDLLFLSLRNLEVLAGMEAGAVLKLRGEIFREAVVALAFFLPLTVHLIFAFTRNLKLFLAQQQRALEEVAQGRLDARVPVASADEFGRIAWHTNQMIAALREREQVRDLFGKLLSPGIARRLLAQEGGRLGGARRQAVVLFSDVRDFTRRTETSEPEALVADLNRYFTRMVEVVHRHGGIVDKFMGDGLMAIFGLDGPEHAAAQAVRAAVEMLDEVESLNREVSQPFAIGIGIHAGEVVAGTIGSPLRMEFTCIGDAVNVAARVEGLTRTVGVPLLITGALHEALGTEAAEWPFVPYGEQTLKGRAGKVRVLGLGAAALTVKAG